MTPEQQQQIIDRLFARRDAAQADTGVPPWTVPPEQYLSAERFQREFEVLFRRLPLILAPASSVARPGDFLTSEDYGVPILVTRDRDGRVHAFLNTCTHRGARLVDGAQGCGKSAFACPYHGWTFGNDGQLLHMTRAECFPDTDKADHGLVRLPVQERCGFIWVILTPGLPIDVDSYLGELLPEIAALQLESHVSYRPYVRPLQGNWKLCLENFLESYHVPYAHSAVVTGKRDDRILGDWFGRHLRGIGPLHTLERLAHVDRQRWRLKSVTWRSYFLFPNTTLIIDPDHVMWHRVYPGRVDQTRVALDVLIPATAQDAWWHAIWDLSRERDIQALEEDMAIVDTISAALRSGMLPHALFGQCEQEIGVFQRAVESALTAAAREAPAP